MNSRILAGALLRDRFWPEPRFRSNPARPIKLGRTSPNSPAEAPPSAPTGKNGIDLAIDEINAKGGVPWPQKLEGKTHAGFA